METNLNLEILQQSAEIQQLLGPLAELATAQWVTDPDPTIYPQLKVGESTFLRSVHQPSLLRIHLLDSLLNIDYQATYSGLQIAEISQLIRQERNQPWREYKVIPTAGGIELNRVVGFRNLDTSGIDQISVHHSTKIDPTGVTGKQLQLEINMNPKSKTSSLVKKLIYLDLPIPPSAHRIITITTDGDNTDSVINWTLKDESGQVAVDPDILKGIYGINKFEGIHGDIELDAPDLYVYLCLGAEIKPNIFDPDNYNLETYRDIFPINFANGRMLLKSNHTYPLRIHLLNKMNNK